MAADGAIVAIAAGSYFEDVTVLGKRLRVWGVCPALVEVVGTGAKPIAMAVFGGASGTEVRALAVRGARIGGGVTGSLDVLFDRVWVHDMVEQGFTAQDVVGDASATLRDSLFESSTGLIIAGADVTLERTVVREGRGLAGVVHPDTGTPSTIALRSSLVERTSDIAVKLSGGEATVEASVIRETQPTAEPASGRGINAQSDTRMGQPATLSVRGSVIEKNYDSGVFLSGVNATIETSVVRDTVKWASPDLVIVVSNPAPASATITATRIEKSTLAAIAAWGAHAAVGRSALVCQAFDLDRETFEGREAALEDLGRNTCGCPDPTGPC